jgi:hypothetical protein
MPGSWLNDAHKKRSAWQAHLLAPAKLIAQKQLSASRQQLRGTHD